MRYFKYREFPSKEFHCVFETNDEKTLERCIWWKDDPSPADQEWLDYCFVEHDDVEEVEITEAETFLYML